MSQNMTVELTDQQRETLLQGLRFVRSSLMLDARDPDAELDAERDARLKQIAALVSQLNGEHASSQASSVS